MKTIKEIADICRVSEQAVRGWCRRNQVAKDAKGSFVIDDSVESLILSYYKAFVNDDAKAVAKDVSQDSESIMALLKHELEQKDKQINDLMEQNKELAKELAAERLHGREVSDMLAVLADQSQKLQLAQMQPQLSGGAIEETPSEKKTVWQRLFGK